MSIPLPGFLGLGGLLIAGSLQSTVFEPRHSTPSRVITPWSQTESSSTIAGALERAASGDLRPGDPAVVTALTAAINGSDEPMQQRALQVLSERAGASRRGGVPQAWASELAGLRSVLKSTIARLMREGPSDVRRSAVMALAALDFASAPPEPTAQQPNPITDDVARLLADAYVEESQLDVRAEIARTLATGGGGSDTERVLGLALAEPDAGLRQFGALGAARIKAATLLPLLIDRVRDTDPGVRRAAATALKPFGVDLQPYAEDIRRARLEEADPEIRQQLGEALASAVAGAQ